MSLKGLERIWSLRRRKTAGNLSGFQGLGTYLRGKFAQSYGRLIGCNLLCQGPRPWIKPRPSILSEQLKRKAFVLRQISLSLACSSPAKSDNPVVQMKRLPLYLPIKRHF